MKVTQALICAGGLGTKLGLGTKSYIIYKDKLILEYLLQSCLKAGITHIVAVIIPKKYESYVSADKLKMLKDLIKRYPSVTFIRDKNYLSFRKVPNYVRKYFNTSKPFYLLCGHSPQSSLFLKKLGKCYKKNSIVTAGYKYRYDFIVSMGAVSKNILSSIRNCELAKPKAFRCKGQEEFIHHFPYILDFSFYDNFVKKDKYRKRIELYPKLFAEKGGMISCIKNPVEISEIDYKRDLGKLMSSIAFISKTDKFW